MTPEEWNDWKGWRAAAWTAAVIWVLFSLRLMIADVWDETNGMLAFSSAAQTLGQKLQFVLTQSLGFWRPLPTLIVATVLHFVRDFDVSWRLLRGLNIVLLLAALFFFLDAATWWGGRSELRRFVMTVAFLFSGSAVIVAGWYANVFDASALLLIAVAMSLLARGRTIEGGVVIGIAFFCKETAALALPFLVVLFAAGRLTFRDTLRAGIPATILGAIYFAIRSRIVAFGSDADVHQFVPEQFLPTVVNLAESFWIQTLKGSGPFALNLVWIVVALVALRRPRLIGAALLFLLAAAIVYWGMFGEYQNGMLMHHLNFVGRLYLVPVALMLFILALERRTLAIAILCLPIVAGAFATWRDHARFQRTYAGIYSIAARAEVRPLTVHYPRKPLNDDVRGIVVRDMPGAHVHIDERTGRLK